MPRVVLGVSGGIAAYKAVELLRRLVGRGTESEEERARRLETAREELAAEDEFDVTVVNTEVHAASEELVALMLNRSAHA